MSAVWKVPIIMSAGVQTYELPAGAQVLHYGINFEASAGPDTMGLWFEVDPDEPTETRAFQLIGTRFDLPEDAVYIGTTVHKGGALILHCFEVQV